MGPWLFFLLLLAAPAAALGPAHLLGDLRSGLETFDPEAPGGALLDGYAATSGGVVFLDRRGQGDALECGLWVTRGEGRAERLADLCSLDLPFAPTGLYMLGGSGSLALFTDAAGKLWRTDGTAAGTFFLADVEPDVLEGLPTLGPDGRTLFLTACMEEEADCEPWITDGTREGTRLLLDVAPGPDGSYPSSYTPYGDRMLFNARDGLWSTDGTPRGTVRLIRTPDQPYPPLFHDGRIFLLSTSSGPGKDEVWVYDPATGASRRLKRFRSGFPFSTAMTVAGGRVLIRHDDGSSRLSSLWETDGTVDGTRPVGPGSSFDWILGLRDVAAGALLSAERVGDRDQRLFILPPGASTPVPLQGCPGGCPKPALNTFNRGAVLHGRLYFQGCRPSARHTGLWVSDGTPGGTRQLQELTSEDCDNDTLSFQAALDRVVVLDGESGDLWATDGTEAGTARLARTEAYFQQEDFVSLAVWNGRAWFTGVDPWRGPQPYTSDLTPEGTAPAARLGGVFAAGSRVSALAALGSRALFAACDGREEGVWASDAGAAGLVRLPVPGLPCGPEPPAVAFFRVGNLAFFAWNGRLWRTDGTAPGTIPLADLPAGSLTNGADLGGRLLLSACPPDPANGSGLACTFWTSDGTPGGTAPAFTFHPGAPPPRMVAAGGLVYFRAYDEDGLGIWRSDGTGAGTFPILRDESLYEGDDLLIARLGGRTYLIAGHREDGDEALRVTDGTEAGTVPVAGAGPEGLAVLGSSLCYFAGYPTGLWCSDGTAAGTRRVKTLPGLSLGGLPELTVAGDRLFFRVNEPDHGVELWTSDGTEAGTRRVKDIVPGAAGSRPGDLTAAGGRLFFAAHDGGHGRELWTSDGTAAGTRRVQDLFPGMPSSAPGQLTAAEGFLYFTADDGRHGREPWALPLR